MPLIYLDTTLRSIHSDFRHSSRRPGPRRHIISWQALRVRCGAQMGVEDRELFHLERAIADLQAATSSEQKQPAVFQL